MNFLRASYSACVIGYSVLRELQRWGKAHGLSYLLELSVSSQYLARLLWQQVKPPLVVDDPFLVDLCDSIVAFCRRALHFCESGGGGGGASTNLVLS